MPDAASLHPFAVIEDAVAGQKEKRNPVCFLPKRPETPFGTAPPLLHPERADYLADIYAKLEKIGSQVDLVLDEVLASQRWGGSQPRIPSKGGHAGLRQTARIPSKDFPSSSRFASKDAPSTKLACSSTSVEPSDLSMNSFGPEWVREPKIVGFLRRNGERTHSDTSRGGELSRNKCAKGGTAASRRSITPSSSGTNTKEFEVVPPSVSSLGLQIQQAARPSALHHHQGSTELENALGPLSSHIRRRSVAATNFFRFVDDPNSGRWAQRYAWFNQIFVFLSVFVAIHASAEGSPLRGVSSAAIETAFDCAMALEFICRACMAPSLRGYLSIPHTWVDLLAATPLLLRAFVGFDHNQHKDHFVRNIMFCYVPVVRLLKILRHFESFRLLVSAFKISLEALPMLLYCLALLTLTFAGFIFMSEPRENMPSLPLAIWFVLMTMTTVGWGDVSPTTDASYAVVTVMSIAGLLFLGIPIGIIGNTFNEVWNKRDSILLVARARSALDKWGYHYEDVPTLFKVVSEGEGELNIHQFCLLLREMNVGLSQDRLVQLFQQIDTDGSGTIDAHEFGSVIWPSRALSQHLDNAVSTVTSGRIEER